MPTRLRNDPAPPTDGEAFCKHSGEKRPLRLKGYDEIQFVCSSCWRKALRMGHVRR